MGSKHDIIEATLTNVGADIEDRREGAKKLISEYAGGKVALSKAKVNYSTVIAALKKDREDGAITEEQFQLIMPWMHRLYTSLDDTRKVMEVNEIRAMGIVAGIEEAMTFVGKRRDANRQRIEELKAVEDGAPDPRNPGPNVAQEQAEASDQADPPKKKKKRTAKKG